MRHQNVLALVECLNGDLARSKRIGIFHLEGTGLYKATTQALPILIRAVNNFVENTDKPAPFHMPVCYTSKKIFLWEQRAVFIDHPTDSALQCFEFLSKSMSHMRMTTISMLPMFSAACVCISMVQRTGKELERLGLKVVGAGLSKTCRSCSKALILRSHRCW